jgi:hypothetical protein
MPCLTVINGAERPFAMEGSRPSRCSHPTGQPARGWQTSLVFLALGQERQAAENVKKTYISCRSRPLGCLGTASRRRNGRPSIPPVVSSTCSSARSAESPIFMRAGNRGSVSFRALRQSRWFGRDPHRWCRARARRQERQEAKNAKKTGISWRSWPLGVLGAVPSVPHNHQRLWRRARFRWQGPKTWSMRTLFRSLSGCIQPTADQG